MERREGEKREKEGRKERRTEGNLFKCYVDKNTKMKMAPKVQLPILSTLSLVWNNFRGPEILPFGWLVPTEDMAHLFLL